MSAEGGAGMPRPPIENMIEKRLGLKSKKEIEEMGLANSTRLVVSPSWKPLTIGKIILKESVDGWILTTPI